LARKNETTTSHMTVLFAAANISLNSNVCVRRPTVAPNIAQAPLGKGVKMNPQMTATNKDNRDQACGHGHAWPRHKVGAVVDVQGIMRQAA
jgi:hypothetical protein